MKYDFCGWATRNDMLCSDGRTIRKNAFKDDDGCTVPLVWNHRHDDPLNVLGHALLKNREEGVYAYCTFNGSESGKNAKLLVEHGDIESLSILANKLKQNGGDVMHGRIREVSLVLAGANPGALIEDVVCHGEDSDEEAVIFTGEEISLEHSDESEDKEIKMEEELKHADDSGKEKNEKTVGEVIDSMTEEQKNVMYFVVDQAIEEDRKNRKASNNTDDEEDDSDMKHNVFENEENKNEVLSHSDIEAIFSDARRYGSLKDAVIAHGIDNIDFLFPDEQNVTQTPTFIERDTSWVAKFMRGVHHTPFSRIKSTFADITEDDARAKGYIKGNLKKEEVFSLLKRTTTPTTVYKKQKMDRDDVIDITDFDVIGWLKSEMRKMLDEEIARAALVGDGRLNSSDDKINEQNIRPIWTDADLFTIKKKITVAANATADQKAKAFIRAAIKARKDYKGSGNPTLYTTEDVLTDCLLLEDNTGRVIYESDEKLARTLRVSEIVTVPVMEGLTRTDSDNDNVTLYGIIVNLADYNIGADKGGAVNMFDDFDIDYNAQKYLIETRCSGALIKPYSAIALELAVGS